MMDRRQLITRSGAALAALGSGMAFGSLRALAADTVTLPFANGERPLVKYPQKRPMIGLTSRPPQLETPFAVFDENVITPNDAFFVRYHLAGIPYDIDPDVFSVEIKGKVDKPTKLSLADIKKLPAVELVDASLVTGPVTMRPPPLMLKVRVLPVATPILIAPRAALGEMISVAGERCSMVAFCRTPTLVCSTDSTAMLACSTVPSRSRWAVTSSSTSSRWSWTSRR